jgi:hypothetical protein
VRALFTDNTTLQFRAHKTLDAAFEAGRSVAMAHGVIQQHHALPSVKLVGGHLDQLIAPGKLAYGVDQGVGARVVETIGDVDPVRRELIAQLQQLECLPSADSA